MVFWVCYTCFSSNMFLSDQGQIWPQCLRIKINCVLSHPQVIPLNRNLPRYLHIAELLHSTTYVRSNSQSNNLWTTNLISYPLGLWLWCVWPSVPISITVPGSVPLSVSVSCSWSWSCRKRRRPCSIPATPHSATWTATRSLVARTGTVRRRVTTSTTIQLLESTVSPSASSKRLSLPNSQYYKRRLPTSITKSTWLKNTIWNVCSYHITFSTPVTNFTNGVPSRIFMDCKSSRNSIEVITPVLKVSSEHF